MEENNENNKIEIIPYNNKKNNIDLFPQIINNMIQNAPKLADIAKQIYIKYKDIQAIDKKIEKLKLESNYNLEKIKIKKNYLENEMKNISKQLDDYNSLLEEIIIKQPNNEEYVMFLLNIIKELNFYKYDLTKKIMEL